jgi:anhydro-N-acetylmuramic acid kinase
LSEADLYIGLMSGTSLDGVDAVLADFSVRPPRVRASAHHRFPASLRAELLALQSPGHDEIARAAVAGNVLALAYAAAVEAVLLASGADQSVVQAIGCHGQTVRHHPERGFTSQIGNPALLAERTAIRVVADFRSRDVAAGGQGAPLAPAFHAEVFRDRHEKRAVLNLGGIANVTRLAPDAAITGFDTGPGNCLMDLWCAQHTGAAFDDGGKWAAGGRVLPHLLARMQEDPYFSLAPPKSTGRDLFNDAWVSARIKAGDEAQSVQATLLELTARSICDAIGRHLPGTQRAIACGGGTKNLTLMARLRELLDPMPLESSDRHGVDPQLVEAVAFAWLARQSVRGLPGNLPAVTGALGPRVLGAVYPP